MNFWQIVAMQMVRVFSLLIGISVIILGFVGSMQHNNYTWLIIGLIIGLILLVISIAASQTLRKDKNGH